MSILQALFLGIIQGLTEFLPISSSGHLVLFQRLFDVAEANLTFDVMVHFGTLVAVIVYFWSDIVEIIKKPLGKLPIYILIGTIPTGIIGLAFKDFFDRLFQTGQTLGVEFLITGLIIWFAESIRSGRKGLREITVTDALLIGTCQGLAILPAISRSGLTIAGSLFRGLDRKFAAKFSFLLSIPAILGATVVEGRHIFSTSFNTDLILPIIIGTIAAGLAGYFAIKLMISILEKSSLKVFSFYVFALGILVLLDQLFFNLYFPPLF